MLFNDKSVVLTCSAPHVLEMEQDFSDFDYVVRVNFQLPLSDEMIRCTGSRADVWYPAKKILQDTPELCQYADVIKIPERYRRLVPRKYRDRIYPMTVNRGHVKRAIQSGPNRGLLAALDIVADQPKLLYITGMGFYQRGDYYEGYENTNPVDPETKGNDLGHDQQKSMAYFAEKVLPFCFVDRVMAEIMKDNGYL
jgi:hypothetical protein